MKRSMVGLIAIVMIAAASQAHAAQYGIKRQITIGGTGPVIRYIGHSKLSDRMYIASSSYNMVGAVNCSTDSLVKTLAGTIYPDKMVYDSVHNRIYMKGTDEFFAIDCVADTLDTAFMVSNGASGCGYNADNDKIYVYDGLSPDMYVLNPVTYASTGTLAGVLGVLHYDSPANSVFTPDAYSYDTLNVYNGATDALKAEIYVPGLGMSGSTVTMASNPSISRLYVSLPATDRVAIVNTATNGLLASPLVGDNPAAFALCPLNGKMFVACNGASGRSLYAIDTLGAVDSVAVSDSITAVAYNPSDSLVYCADYNRGYVRMVDPRGATPMVVDSVYLGMSFAHPVALAVDNGGDVYVASSSLDWVSVVGKVPGRMWRSVTASGQWFSPSSWEYSDNGGITWGNPDSIYPSAVGDSIITIQGGHTIALDIGGPNVTVDQLTVDGMLAQFGTAFTIADGPGVDLHVNGNYQFSGGTLTFNAGATMAVGAGGQYTHDTDGGTVPAATWDPASTLRIDSVATTVPAGMDQSFGAINWSSSYQAADMVLPGGAAFSVQSLDVNYTGTGRLFLTSATVPDLTIGGDLNIGGTSDVVLGGGGTRSVTVNGNFNVSDPGWLHLTDSAGPGLSTLNLRGNYWHGASGIGGGGPDSTIIVFCGTDTQQYGGSSEIFTGYVNYRVDPGAFLRINDFSYVGQYSLGWFRLMAGATLGFNDYQGLYLAGDSGAVRVAGARSYSTDASYYFYSFSTGPFPTGPGFPDTVRQLIVASPGDPVVLSKDLAVRDTLSLRSGPLRVGSRRLSLLGAVTYAGGDLQADSTSRLAVLGNSIDPIFIPATVTGLDTLVLDRPAGINLGAPLPILGAYVQRRGMIGSNWLQYRTAATLVYEMAGADTTAIDEFPVSDGPRAVTVATGGPLYLHDDRTVPGAVSLIQGALVTGARTLTVDSLGTVNRTAGYVDGNLRRYVRQIDTMVVYDLGTAAAGYTPVRLRPYNTAAAGFVSAGIIPQTHPMVSNASACLRKYWSLSSQALTVDSCRLTFGYAASDFNPPNFTEATDEAAMAAGRYAHGAVPGWAGPVIAARNAGGTADGGSIVISRAGGFPDTVDYTMGRDSFALWAPYDSSAPTVVSLSPANGDTGVGLFQPVVIGFSEPVTDTSVTFSCIPAVAGWSRSWNANSTIVTLTHVPFSPATQYTFTVTGARDTTGVPMSIGATAVFNTAQVQSISTPWRGGRYQLMSVPALPVDSTATGVLGTSLGAYGGTTWRMFGYDQQQARYVESPLVRNGRGYWLASVDSAVLSVSCSPNNAPQTVLSMEPGWNLFGDPYPLARSLGGLEVGLDTGLVYRYDDSSGAVNNTMLRQRVWTYTDNRYDLINNGAWDTLSPFDETAQVQPWGGYAVYAVGRCYLHFLAAKEAPRRSSPPPTADVTWRLRIDAENSGGADRGLVMGVSPQAAAGYDRLDAEKPPMISSQITAEIPHPEWDQGPCDAYHYDFRPPAGYLEWPLRLRQGSQDSRGSLLLTPSGSLAAGQRAYLVDRKRGTALEIAGPTAVSFTGSREFAVVCSDRTMGSLDLKPLVFGIDRLAPNPCTGTATISYQLPRSGTVSLKLYNVAGQLVRTLVNGRQDAGYYDIRWNGQGNDRLAASSGLYFVRLAFGGETRTQKLVKLE